MTDLTTLIASAIEAADQSSGFSMSLIRLVDGVSTNRLTIGDEVFEFTDYVGDEMLSAEEQCYAKITEMKNRARSSAVLTALTGRMVDAVTAAERFSPKAIPMGGAAPIFGGMQVDADGAWVSYVDVAKRLRRALDK